MWPVTFLQQEKRGFKGNNPNLGCSRCKKVFHGTIGQQVIRVEKLVGLPPPTLELLGRLSEGASLKLLRLSELQRTNSSPISICWRSKSAILCSHNINYNINYNINSLLRLRVGMHIIYIYIYIYISDECYIPEVEMKTI